MQKKNVQKKGLLTHLVMEMVALHMVQYVKVNEGMEALNFTHNTLILMLSRFRNGGSKDSWDFCFFPQFLP